MFNKQKLNEMFNFTTNKTKTIQRMLFEFLQITPVIVYQFVLSKNIDNYIPHNNVRLSIIICLIYVLYIWIRIVLFNYYLEKQRSIICYDNDRQIKNKVFKNIQKAKISELDKIQVGTLFSISTSQSFDAARLFIWNFLGLFAYRIKSILITFIIMLFISWKIALVILLIFTISYIVLIPFYNKSMKNFKKIHLMIIDLQGKVNEYIDSFSTNKTLRLEEINIEDIREMLNKSKNELIKSSKTIGLHTSIFSLLTFNATIVTLIIGGNQILLGIGLASSILLMLDYINDINGHMKGVLDHIHEAMNKYSAFLNVLSIRNIEKEEDNGLLCLNKITSIEFNNVKMSYNEKDTILENINLKINKPMKVAIVGKSGSGKTTLINLIPRFYDLTDGNIFINGVDYKEYKLNELRKNISYVFQEPVILNMSIKENLNYGLENISFEEIRKICIKLGLDNKIMSLPNKYDTIINSKTDLLSFGEKQLLSYARAILKNGDIVILDEVTSNLDLEFEQNILSANKELLKEKISFIIAHRLNTIKDADLIIFIENKHIIEAGTHEELLKLNGKYSKLFLTK